MIFGVSSPEVVPWEVPFWKRGGGELQGSLPESTKARCRNKRGAGNLCVIFRFAVRGNEGCLAPRGEGRKEA